MVQEQNIRDGQEGRNPKKQKAESTFDQIIAPGIGERVLIIATSASIDVNLRKQNDRVRSIDTQNTHLVSEQRHRVAGAC